MLPIPRDFGEPGYTAAASPAGVHRRLRPVDPQSVSFVLSNRIAFRLGGLPDTEAVQEYDLRVRPLDSGAGSTNRIWNLNSSGGTHE